MKEFTEISEALNRCAREELKLTILKDIRADISICKLEGWDYKEYLNELINLISQFIKE